MNENQVTKEKISMAEAMRLKRKLELDIYELLDEFTKATTLVPTRVNLSLTTLTYLIKPKEKILDRVDVDVDL